MPHLELSILRHAKSDWDKSCGDFERPLNTRGRGDALKIGQWLLTQSYHPDAIYSSTARRAAETARAICAGIGVADELIHWDKRLYLATRDKLLEFMASHPDSQSRVLLIGHNPGLEDLLCYLAPDTDQYVQRDKLLTTASFARLSLSGSWGQLQRHSAKLEQFVRPRDLSADANI